MKKLLTDWRILLVVGSVILALIAIWPFPQSGVVVTNVALNSPLYGIVQPGEMITFINDVPTNSPDAFYAFDNFTGSLRFLHNGRLDLANIQIPGLGVTVAKPQLTKINLGIDFVGGTRVLLTPKENVTPDVFEQTLSIIETRINVYGLREAKFQEVSDVSGKHYIQIEMAGGSREEIENLLGTQGKFEAKVAKVISLNNGIGTLLLGNNSYEVKSLDDKITVAGQTVSLNQSFRIEDIDFLLANKTSNTTVLLATVFNSSDIKSVCLQNQAEICTSRVYSVQTQQGVAWRFEFQVFITPAGANRFAELTKNMKIIVDPNTKQSYLESPLYLYLDNNLLDTLNIVSDLKGKAETKPAITGGATTESEALKSQQRLKGILQSGSLPIPLDITSVDQISASLGQEFIKATAISGLVAFLFVGGVIFLRYRKIKILIPMMLWSMSELLLTLGVAAFLRQWWTIDLASVAGIIAAIGTGTNDQIMIIDEILIGGGEERRIYTLKKRIGRAFFIIFGAAATIVAAMLPMAIIGVSVMKGFAIATMVGVFIGVFITRPAFGKVAEYILGGTTEESQIKT